MLTVSSLFILAIVIACVAWTITHEEISREFREYCTRRSTQRKSTLFSRKFFYMFTCEYCFSHYVAALVLWMTRYHLFFTDWRGYILAGFALVGIANVYMSLFGLVRTDMKKEKVTIERMEEGLSGKV